MDSREVPPPQPQQLQPPSAAMLMGHNSFHTNNRNPNAAMIGPNSTTQAIHHSAGGVRLPFGALAPQHQHQPPPPQHQMEPKTLDSLGFDGSPSSAQHSMRFGIEQQAKKKRGRPRKYAPDGNIALGLAPTSPLPSASNSYGGGADVVGAGGGGGGGGGDGGGNNANSADPPAKRNRGRPPGSGKKQLEALGGTGGVGFTPHVIEVKSGEDIASKVMAFSQQGPRAICILSASGAVCSVTLRQATSSNGVVTYEGRFEIISLTGSFLNSESNGNLNRTGSLSVSLAGPDGRILGGGVAGMLVAGSKVQVIVGSFIPDGRKQKSSNARASNPEPASAPANMLNFGGPTHASPRSQGPSSESSEENDSGSPLHRGSHGLYGNSSQPLNPMQMYHLWTGHSQ